MVTSYDRSQFMSQVVASVNALEGLLPHIGSPLLSCCEKVLVVLGDLDLKRRCLVGFMNLCLLQLEERSALI